MKSKVKITLSTQKVFLTDEAGANFNGTGQIFRNSGLKKAYSCQFHNKKCLSNLVKKNPGELCEVKAELEDLALKMLNVTSYTEYNGLKRRLEELGG